MAGIAGDSLDRRVDLVETPVLGRPGVRGQRAGAEADDRDACLREIERAEELSDRTGTGEEGGWLAGQRRVEALLTVERATVDQPVDGVPGVLGHAQHAEEVAFDVQQAAGRPLAEAGRRHHRPG